VDDSVLVIQNGELSGRRYKADVLIGRDHDCDIRLPDRKVSRRHARVELAADGAFVEDLGSRHGTLLNSRRVQRHSLKAGDVLQIGKTKIEYVVGEGSTDHWISRPFPAEAALDPDVEARSRNYEVVLDVARQLQGALTIDDLLQQALSLLFEVIEGDRADIVLLDPETGEIIKGLARHRDPEIGEIPLNVSRTIIRRVRLDRKPIISVDAHVDARFVGSESVRYHQIRSIVCSPIISGSRVIGAIQLDRFTPVGIFGESESELLQIVGSLLGERIEQARIFDEQAETIEQLKSARHQLQEQERLAILGRLASGLTHEIRNMLMPFCMSESLFSEVEPTTDQAAILSMMNEALDQIVGLVSEVRDLAIGKSVELNIEPHALDEVIRKVARFMRAYPGFQRHTLSLVLEELPPVECDASRLKLVLINLLRNAVDAMGVAGDVTIRLGPDPNDGRIVRIEVSDTGAGIPPEAQARIFEPFFTTKSDSGTGLGLDICRKIIEQHAGRIECQSEVGKGTTMVVSLPFQGRKEGG
jgi:signal transduction histidine kinase